MANESKIYHYLYPSLDVCIPDMDDSLIVTQKIIDDYSRIHTMFHDIQDHTKKININRY